MGVRSLGNALSSFGYKFGTTGLEAVTPAPIPAGITASGGIINDYEEGGNFYRSHTFVSSGSFVVAEAASGFANSVDYLVVAGGGAGDRAEIWL